jgi:type IV pilus secretin PilQ/predicted competence protein
VPGSRAKPSGAALITLHADNLDVRKALEIVSRQARMNILVASGVGGEVTLDVREKTVEETLEAIAKLCHLTIRREKDVFYVTTLADLRQNEEDNLPVRVYYLNYVRSSDVDAMIKPLLSSRGTTSKSPNSEVGLTSDVVASSGSSGSGGGGGGGGGSSAAVQAGGNTMAGGEILIVQDYEQVLKTVDRVVAEIDIQPPQVLIEAVILEVTLDKHLELGVNAGILDGAGNALGVIGNGSLINAAAGFTPASVLTAGGKVADGVSSGFAENTAGIKFGWVGGNTTGFIRALESLADTKVLASPRLLVLNKQRAEIHLGDELGYQTSTVSQTSTTQTVQFLNVGTQLRLRPFVSSDGWVRMEIHPERSSGLIDDNGIPQANTSQITTNVMIPDGATIVIGGLIDTEVDKNWTGIPFLSRIPLLGYLFRNTVEDTPKKELVVLLTPHIWRPQCPQALNYLGRPNCLGLEPRVSQLPHEERRDGPSLLEIPPPRVMVPPPGAPAPVPAPAAPSQPAS